MSVVSSEKKTTPQPHSSPFYNNLVPAYQAVWPAVARKRIQSAVPSLKIAAGARVLEVGVGTGLSLDSYPVHAQVTGVDLSESMLAEAQNLIHNRGWDHVKLIPMNAEQLEFDDDSFDFVTSFHTISVVSKPDAMMREIHWQIIDKYFFELTTDEERAVAFEAVHTPLRCIIEVVPEKIMTWDLGKMLEAHDEGVWYGESQKLVEKFMDPKYR